MRHGLALSCVAVAVGAIAAPPAAAQSSGDAGQTGGTGYAEPVRPALEATAFRVAPARVRPGQAARFTYRLGGTARHARVSIDVRRRGAAAAAAAVPVGVVRTHRRLVALWTPPAGLAPGRYVAHLRASARGRTDRAAARLQVLAAPPAPPPPAPAPGPGVFPVRGPYSLGGPGSGFGAPRTGHRHEGHDIAAAEGTPVVAPQPGAVSVVAYQAHGAGRYVVLHGDDGRDVVLMHLRAGSVVSPVGARVAAGTPVAQVGATGTTGGPHLHLEIWAGGWHASAASRPVDPLPDLLAWAAAG